MYRTQSTLRPDDARRGLILLVVLFMLTLFAIAGISLVLYADAEASAARLNRDAAIYPQPDMEPELAVSYFLSQLLYDSLDDETGIYSALRGHSLSRNMWGLETTWDATRNRWTLNNNYVSYHGAGRLHFPGPLGQDDYYLINYQYFPVDGFLRDPERYGPRASPAAPRTQPYIGGNVCYTYPDLNSMFLAAARADGTVLIPSFHRPWLFNPGLALNDPSNPNWTNAEGKYKILRPRPMDHAINPTTGQPLFPYPEDAYGDVKNWPWAPGGNDSIWIDIDAPVLVAPDGRKYKMLVAPLIVDLDNRINVNVHGNVQGGPTFNFDHRSNQGWGPWEVNPGRVLNADPNEWKQLINGRPFAAAPSWQGRYGINRLPGNGGIAVPLLQTPPFYSSIDYDGFDESSGGPTLPVTLQTGGTASAFSVFPTFPATGYGNASVTERTNHPVNFNAFKTDRFDVNNDDRLFGPANMPALLGMRDTGSEARSNCDVIRLLPLNLNNPGDPVGSARRRMMLTTTSFDLDRPGVVPYIWDPADATTTYKIDSTRTPLLPYPTGAAMPFPNPTTQRATTPANSEFSPSTWQSVNAVLGRLNLDRPLRPYPAPDPTTNQITDLTSYNNAQSDRQTLAKDIFLRLQQLTGTQQPAIVAAGSGEYNALRWLAQLAVNIVDYIDVDDYNTAFTWFGTEVVFGTELPRIVLNEAYVQLDNLKTDPTTGATAYNMNFWVELHNPFRTNAALTNNGDGQLAIVTDATTTPPTVQPIYQIVLLDSKDAKLRDVDNVRGDPDPVKVMKTHTKWVPDATLVTDRVMPCNVQWRCMAGGPNGESIDAFYVVGPETTYQPNADPAFTVLNAAGTPVPAATIVSPELTYTVPNNDAALATLPQPTILLRRLLCPHLPPNSTVGAANYNPYITVDYMEDLVPVDGRLFNAAGAALTPLAMTDRASVGKNQPYASHLSQRVAQAPATPGATQPKHTFLRHNGIEDNGPPTAAAGQTLKVPFDWLVHLDRQLISPVELLHVSAFKPHELTQQFVAPTVADPTVIAPFQHVAPWLIPESRISRLFGFVENKDRLFESAQGGRVAGRINLNTVFDEEIFQALLDAGPSNGFNQADVSAAWARFLARRTPGGTPGPNDRPLLDPSTGYVAPGGAQFPNGVSVHDTILGNGSGAGLFYDPSSAAHPYFKYEMLNKMYSNVTVRSNVFAVWMTVGFFEVVDDSTRPVKLGAEMNRAEGRHVRHRMFAVVDRSNTSVFAYRLLSNLPVTPGTYRDVLFQSLKTPDPLSGDTPGGLRWDFYVGLPLVFDPDNRREETTVINNIILPNLFSARITQSHPPETRIIARGNVGPWAGFDPRQNARVVPYWAIIE